MQYMSKSLKPTLFTFIPIIFIFAWMNGHFTYAPLDPSDPLTIKAYFHEGFAGVAALTAPTLEPASQTAPLQPVKSDMIAAFTITGPPGVHNASVKFENLSLESPATIYLGARPLEASFRGSGPVERIDVEYPRIRPLGNFHIGSWYPGWLAVYIVLSIILSVSTRKLMKIY
jgi:hypothetical protein